MCEFSFRGPGLCYVFVMIRYAFRYLYLYFIYCDEKHALKPRLLRYLVSIISTLDFSVLYTIREPVESVPVCVIFF